MKNYFLRDDNLHDLNAAYMADFLSYFWFFWVLLRGVTRHWLIKITHLHFKRLFSISFQRCIPNNGGARRLGCRMFLSKVLQWASTHTIGPQLAPWLCTWSILEFHEFTELPSCRMVADCTNLTFSDLYLNLLYVYSFLPHLHTENVT